MRVLEGGLVELCDEAIRMRVMWLIMLSLLALHSDGQLVFLSKEERAALSKLNPCLEPSQSDVLANLFSTDISTVYRLGKRLYIVSLRPLILFNGIEYFSLLTLISYYRRKDVHTDLQ